MGEVWIFLFLILLLSFNVYSQEVSLTTDKEMPRAGDTLLMTCTVSGIDLSTDDVLIRKLKNDGSSEILADKNGTTNLPDKWLLIQFSATTGGGSMSIYSSKLMKSDIGDYSCTVLRGQNTVGQDDISLDILHVPSIIPYCSQAPNPQSNGNYYEGEVVTFSCSIDPGNPTVNLVWSRNDELSIPQPNITETQNHVVSEITMTLSIRENGVLFTCTSTSDEFQDYAETCIPGSITVVTRPTTIQTTTITTPSPATTQQLVDTTTQMTVTSKAPSSAKSAPLQHPSTAESSVTSTNSTSLSETLTTNGASSSSFFGDVDLKIWVIAGACGGVLLIVIAVILLCCVIRSCMCCSRDPKLILPTTNAPSSYYNDVQYEPELEMRQSNNGKEGIVPHVSSSDGTVYARVNKDRKSVNSRNYRKQDDSSTYPESEFDDSSQGGYYMSNENDELEPEPPVRTASERLYEITPSDSDNEEHIQENQYGNVTTLKPSYLDDLDPHYGNLE